MYYKKNYARMLREDSDSEEGPNKKNKKSKKRNLAQKAVPMGIYAAMKVKKRIRKNIK